MNFETRLGDLAEELVEAATRTTAKTHAQRFKNRRDAALRTLKAQQFLRTNQFDVENSLVGLEERFRVNHREPLADALRQRLETLHETPSKWHPEILHLLLELSDQPTFNAKLSDLDLLRSEAGGVAPEQLRWEDIAREDGWADDAAIWKSIKYSDSSDDEDGDYNLDETQSEASTAESEAPIGRTAEDFIVHPEDVSQFDLVRQEQQWRAGKAPVDFVGHARKRPVSEFHIVREVLFMLQGLDTTILAADGTPNTAFQMAHVTWDTHKAVLGYFCAAGRRLASLRRFVAKPQRASHLQVFHDSVAKRLADFDRVVTEVQAELVLPERDAVVTLLSVKSSLASSLKPLYSLSDIIVQIQDASNVGAFRYLELLFEGATVAQLADNLAVYEFLARIFIECFNVYLRPIRLWMDEGKLLPGDRIFFVTESPSKVSLSQIWDDKYMLRGTADGTLHAPNFLHPAAAKIFNTGKNIVILKQLGRFDAARSGQSREPPLDFETMCPPGFQLAPFPDLFGAAFDRWIQSKYNTTSATLQKTLFKACNLWDALDALQYLYFMTDGSATEAFASTFFGKLDALTPDWQNRYGLTSIAQDAFSLVDLTRLSVNIDPQGLRLSAKEARDSVRTAVPTVRLKYQLAWPVQMILSEESLSHYQSIFTFLLQLRRVLYALRKLKVLECYWTDHDRWDESALFYSLRANLLWFCNAIHTYLATLVLAPNSAKMRRDLEQAHDVDAMIAVHTAFAKRVVDESCLGSRLKPIRECVLDLFDLGIRLDQAHSANVVGQEDSSSTGTDEARGDTRSSVEQSRKPYMDELKEIQADFDRHLRFICGGLRSVARASSDVQSAKWDLLAEMLQTGSDQKLGTETM